jgi:hypothetical protein
MNRTLAVMMLVSLGFSGAPTASQETSAPARAQIETELRLERKLLALDLAAYREARGRERTTRDRVTEVTGRMDETLGGDSLALGTLETLHDELASAREAARTASDRVDGSILRLQDRLRRIGFLEGEIQGGGPAVPRPDAVTGRWRAQILPLNQTATFDLRLDGTVVTGTYQIDGGSSGSFRGTYANNEIRLERVDTRLGFDSVFRGTVGTGRMAGTWEANELASGRPNRGEWTAVREER